MKVTAPVFVTGAAGHVGTNLVRRLLRDGASVRVLLRHEDNNEALDGLDVQRVFGDIRDLEGRESWVTGPKEPCRVRYRRRSHSSVFR